MLDVQKNPQNRTDSAAICKCRVSGVGAEGAETIEEAVLTECIPFPDLILIICRRTGLLWLPVPDCRHCGEMLLLP